MRILIVDDEISARKELGFILAELLPEAALTEAVTGMEALDLLAAERFDAVFLDINMPGINGLEVAARLLDNNPAPHIIFATAYDRHAVRAFELAALDYVVKPFDEERLAETARRIRQLLARQDALAQQREAVRDYLSKALPAEPLARLWAERENGNRLPVELASVLWIEAEGKKVFIQTHEARLLIRYTLKELEGLLPSGQFQRVHKAFIVNLGHVAELAPFFSGGYVLRMKDAARTEIPVSRRYATQLRARSDWR